jgi:hypothetical protein
MRRILKFKRHPVKSDRACLEKCTELGVDPTALSEQLKDGVTTPETTTYFCCLYALTQRPNMSTIRQAVSQPLVPNARKCEIPASPHQSRICQARSSFHREPRRAIS